MASELNPKQERAITALLSTSRLNEAARLAGVSDSTLGRWLRDAAFKERLRQERGEAIGAAVGSLQVAMATAAETLCTVAADPAQPGAVRVSAAKAILDAGLRAAMVDDLGAQVDEMRAALDAMQRSQGQ